MHKFLWGQVEANEPPSEGLNDDAGLVLTDVTLSPHHYLQVSSGRQGGGNPRH